jgi:hypothetical protein
MEIFWSIREMKPPEWHNDHNVWIVYSDDYQSSRLFYDAETAYKFYSEAKKKNACGIEDYDVIGE